MALLLLPALAAGFLSPAAAQSQPLPNVLLITVDTLRADHLSCYGYHLRTSPHIDALAAEGVRFTRATTVIPLTGPAHISLFTSRYPQEHGARINGLAANEKAKLLFLPQILRGAGYRTAAFVSAWPLNSRLTHLDRWFDHYDEDLPRTYQMFNSQRYAEDVGPRAIDWLKQSAGRPFFLWVHFFDPHSPYDQRDDFINPRRIEESGSRAPQLDSDDARERVRVYDSEIGYCDHWIGKILDTLDAAGLRSETLVVLTADHGESLGEHDYVGHGQQLYQPIVHIPLIFRFPGRVAEGKTVDTGVSILDLAPTIIDLTVRPRQPDFKLPFPLGGRSFAASLNGAPAPREKLVRYVTFGAKKGWMPKFLMELFVDLDGLPMKMGQTLGDRKVIWSPGEEKLEVFDLGSDPLELNGTLPKRRSPLFRTESNRLLRWFHQTAGAGGEDTMTEKDIEVLRSLGYIQ